MVAPVGKRLPDNLRFSKYRLVFKVEYSFKGFRLRQGAIQEVIDGLVDWGLVLRAGVVCKIVRRSGTEA